MSKMEPIEANARYRLGALSSDAIVALANAWLDTGIYAESLGQLFTIAKPEVDAALSHGFAEESG